MHASPLLYTLPAFPSWVLTLIVVARNIIPFAFPVALRLSLVFPEVSPLLRRFPRLEFYLYIPHLLTAFPYFAVLNVLRVVAPAEAHAFPARHPVLEGVSAMILPLYILASMVSYAITYRRAGEAMRRKIRVVVVGSTLGALPVVLLMLAIALLGLQSAMDITAREWLISAVFVALLLVPASFSYAIVRHRVIPVSLLIRRSLQYLLAKNALRLLLALPLMGLGLTILSERHRTLAEIVFRNSIYFYLLAIGATLLIMVYRRRLGAGLTASSSARPMTGKGSCASSSRT